MVDEFRVGEIYYELGFSPVGDGGASRIVVSAVRYDGFQGRTSGSHGCDVAAGCLRFTRIAGGGQLRVLTDDVARTAIFNWREFREQVIALGEDGSDPDSDDGNLGGN